MAAPVSVMTRSFGFKTTVRIGTGSAMSSLLRTGAVDKDASGDLIARVASDHALLFLGGNRFNAPYGVAAGQLVRDDKGVGHAVG